MRIGIWNTAFLGDAVLALPLIRTVAAAFPEAEIDFYVRKGLGTLFSAQPELTAVYEYDKRGRERGLAALRSLVHKLQERHYAIWIDAHSSIRSALVAYLSHPDFSAGYEGGPIQTFCHTVTVDRRFAEVDEIERLQELLRPVLPEGFSFTAHFEEFCHSERVQPDPPALPAPWPELLLPAQALEKAAAFRQSCSGPLLGLHPGSVWATKRWSTAGFAAIAQRAAALGADILIFSGSGEEDLAAEIVHLAGLAGKSCLHNFAGKLALPDLAAMLGTLDCYVTNDSGPMHLAWIQKTPLVALFGPTTQELGFFPRGETSTVFEVPLDCRPCGKHGHTHCPRNHHRCMNHINVDEVWETVDQKLCDGRPDTHEEN